MKSKIILTCFALSIFLLFNSCETMGPVGPEGPEGPEGPAGSDGPALSGTLVGFVTLYDEIGNLVSDKSGVLVTVEGSEPILSATTNNIGRFQIDNLKTGTYDLVFSKSNYVTYNRLGFSFVGGVKPSLQYVTISQQSTSVVTDLTAHVDPNISSRMVINANITTSIPEGNTRYTRFFIGNSPSVSSTNYLMTFTFGTSANTIAYTRTIDYRYTPSGSTLYIIAYGSPYYSYSYPDLTTGTYIYQGLGAGSNISFFVVP